MSKKLSVCAEAIGHVITMHGPLTDRERVIAEAAARSAYRAALGEIIEELEEKVGNA